MEGQTTALADLDTENELYNYNLIKFNIIIINYIIIIILGSTRRRGLTESGLRALCCLCLVFVGLGHMAKISYPNFLMAESPS